MRIVPVAFAVGATTLLAACAQTPEPPQPVASRTVQQPWVLIAPPDNIATVAFLDTFEYLPDHRARFPRDTNGLNEQDRRSLQSLFERVAAQPQPADRLEILTDVSAETGAPLERWREVRAFKSEDACRSTREELVTVTAEQTRKFGAYPRMPREEFQWTMLARSFQWSRCVPAREVERLSS
ncbi:MAG: hypothetical protein K0S96_1894 [Geminicoccaceae bacterium]|nr:hypothetical protein [Geminicoccaceae bacterium]